MRPLDIIQELVGASYNVAPGPAFSIDGNLYTTQTRNFNKRQVIEVVARLGMNLYVFGCFPMSLNRGDESMFCINYAAVTPRTATRIKLRILK